MIKISYATAIFVFCVGLYTILSKRNLFKTVIGLTIMEAGALMLIVTAGYVRGGVPPLIPIEGQAVNPLPHAFTLTAIVIGASDVALALALVIKVHRRYGTVDLDKIRGLKE
jgi:multicomponent Na+:H+ antiporter subunit C